MGDAVNVASRLEGFTEVDRIKLNLSNRTLRAFRVRVAAFDGT